MTATGHALIGTVIAAKIGNPALAVPIALASHFAADSVPHWDTGLHRKQNSKKRFFTQTFIDVVVGFILSYVLISLFFPSTNLTYAFFIVIIAQLPDWLTAPYLFFDMNFPPFSSTYKLQKVFDHHLGAPWGIVNQVTVVVLVIVLGKFL